jgi:signal transduction histidine kinase
MEGTGLGLAIYHRFAQLLGSEIDVKSTLEQGSIFKFRSPRPSPIRRKSSQSNLPSAL